MEEGRTSGEYATAGCRRLASFRQDGANGTHWNPDFRFLAVDPFPSPRSLPPPFFPALSIVLCSLFSFFLFSRISTVWNSFRKDGEVGRGEEGRRRGERKERNRKEEARDRKRGEGNEVRKEVKKKKGTNPRG